MEDYLHDFLEKLDLLKLNGVEFNSQKLSFDIKCFLCDAPARSFLKCIVGHTGYYACERCLMKGLWSGRVVFNSHEICPIRTACTRQTTKTQSFIRAQHIGTVTIFRILGLLVRVKLRLG